MRTKAQAMRRSPSPSRRPSRVSVLEFPVFQASTSQPLSSTTPHASPATASNPTNSTPHTQSTQIPAPQPENKKPVSHIPRPSPTQVVRTYTTRSSDIPRHPVSGKRVKQVAVKEDPPWYQKHSAKKRKPESSSSTPRKKGKNTQAKSATVASHQPCASASNTQLRKASQTATGPSRQSDNREQSTDIPLTGV